MITDDRDFAERFRARAATFPEPTPQLFTVTLHRLGTRTPHGGNIVSRVTNVWLGISKMLRGGILAAAAVACLVLAVSFNKHDTTLQPVALMERVTTAKVDPAYAPPSGAVAPAPKQIKINTLKTMSSASAETSSNTHDADGATAPAPPPAPDAAIARAETLALLVRSVPDSIAALNALARAHGGFVTKVEDNAPDDADSPRTAALSLTVAAPQLDTATTRILALGAIQSRSATAEAIGDSIVDDRARLRNLRREETDLLHIMDRSGSVASILDVESKLADVRGQIEQLTAHLATSNHRVATAQIDITLTESKPAPTPAKPSLGDHVSATWNAALRSVIALGVGSIDFAIWVGAYLPLLLASASVAATIIYIRRSRF